MRHVLSERTETEPDTTDNRTRLASMSLRDVTTPANADDKIGLRTPNGMDGFLSMERQPDIPNPMGDAYSIANHSLGVMSDCVRSADGEISEADPVARSLSPDDAKIAVAIPASMDRRPALTSFVSADAAAESLNGILVTAKAKARANGVLPTALTASREPSTSDFNLDAGWLAMTHFMTSPNSGWIFGWLVSNVLKNSKMDASLPDANTARHCISAMVLVSGCEIGKPSRA